MAQLTLAKQADYVARITPVLKEVAKAGETIGYTKLMNRVGGPGRRWTGGVLCEICVAEEAAGRPLVTAIVVHEGTTPGPGYWELPM